MPRSYPPEFRRKVLDVVACEGRSPRSPGSSASATRRFMSGVASTSSIRGSCRARTAATCPSSLRPASVSPSWRPSWPFTGGLPNCGIHVVRPSLLLSPRAFGGVPMTIVYNRTKTVVRRHVAPGEAVPLHPEAVAFAGHYDFDIDVLAAYRPTGKGQVERQVLIVRDHVLAGPAFSSAEEMDAAFTARVPMRRAKLHGTHGEVIGHRAVRNHMTLRPLPQTLHVVAQRPLRHVGKDCLAAFDANLYLVPARKVRARQLVEIPATKSQISLHSTIVGANGETLLAVHPRAVGRGARVVDVRRWDGLPKGDNRRVTTGDDGPAPPPRRLGRRGRTAQGPAEPVRQPHRGQPTPLSVYEELTGTRPFTPNSTTREAR